MLLTLLFTWSLARAEKSAFEQSLERDTGVASTESWVEIKGTRYRKIEFNSEHYYIVFKNPQALTADIYCEPPAGHQSEHLVMSDPETIQRSAAFVQAFHETCKSVKGSKKAELRLNPAAGLSYSQPQK